MNWYNLQTSLHWPTVHTIKFFHGRLFYVLCRPTDFEYMNISCVNNFYLLCATCCLEVYFGQASSLQSDNYGPAKTLRCYFTLELLQMEGHFLVSKRPTLKSQKHHYSLTSDFNKSGTIITQTQTIDPVYNSTSQFHCWSKIESMPINVQSILLR